MEYTIVEVVPALEKAGGAKAKPVGSEEKPLHLWFGTKYPKASRSMVKLRRLSGTKWKAIQSNNGWDAIELIKE